MPKSKKIVDLPGGVRVTLEGPEDAVESVLREITDVNKPVPYVPPVIIERPAYPRPYYPWWGNTWGGMRGQTNGSISGSSQLRIAN